MISKLIIAKFIFISLVVFFKNCFNQFFLFFRLLFGCCVYSKHSRESLVLPVSLRNFGSYLEGGSSSFLLEGPQMSAQGIIWPPPIKRVLNCAQSPGYLALSRVCIWIREKTHWKLPTRVFCFVFCNEIHLFIIFRLNFYGFYDEIPHVHDIC